MQRDEPRRGRCLSCVCVPAPGQVPRVHLQLVLTCFWWRRSVAQLFPPGPCRALPPALAAAQACALGPCRLINPVLASGGHETQSRVGAGTETAHLCLSRLLPLEFRRSRGRGIGTACSLGAWPRQPVAWGRGLRAACSLGGWRKGAASPFCLLSWCRGYCVAVYFFTAGFSLWGGVGCSIPGPAALRIPSSPKAGLLSQTVLRPGLEVIYLIELFSQTSLIFK